MPSPLNPFARSLALHTDLPSMPLASEVSGGDAPGELFQREHISSVENPLPEHDERGQENPQPATSDSSVF